MLRVEENCSMSTGGSNKRKERERERASRFRRAVNVVQNNGIQETRSNRTKGGVDVCDTRDQREMREVVCLYRN